MPEYKHEKDSSNINRELGKEEEAVIFAGDFNSLPTMEPYLIARLVDCLEIFITSISVTQMVTYLMTSLVVCLEIFTITKICQLYLHTHGSGRYS